MIIVKLRTKDWNNQNKRNNFEANNQHHTMNRILLAITMIFVITNGLLAQRKTRELDNQKLDEEKKADDTYGKNDSWKDKMIYGGSFGGALGNQSSFFMIQPIVGYKFTDKIQAGISPLYIYSSRTINIGGNKTLTQSINAFGPGVFGRYFVNDNIFAHIEYLGLQYNIYDDFYKKDISKYSNSLFVGGGYMPGGGSGIYVVALYDLLYDSKTSFYSNPLDIRVGFLF